MNDTALFPVCRKHGEHPVDVHDIDPRALKIVRQLDEAGFEAFLVGGCLRDLLLGKRPKDLILPPMPARKRSRRFFATAA